MALLIAVFGLHRLLVWVRREKPWRWAWTWGITALMLMLFAASIAMTGIIHQAAWMASEPISTDKSRSRIMTNVSNVKQMFYLLIEFDQEEGFMPGDLKQMIDEGFVREGAYDNLLFHPSHGPPEPWLYLGKGTSTDDLLNERGAPRILLLSPSPLSSPQGEQWIGLLMDGSAKRLTEKTIREKHPEVLEMYPNLF